MRGGALNLWHQTVKRQSHTPVSSNKTYIRKCRQECDYILQSNIALTRIGMPYWFATMRKYQQLILAHYIHKGRKQGYITQFITLTMGHQFAQAKHASLCTTL